MAAQQVDRDGLGPDTRSTVTQPSQLAASAQTVSASRPQPLNDHNASMDELTRASHAHRLEQRDRFVEDKGTALAYARHVKGYEAFWERFQAEKKAENPDWTWIPAHPITAVKASYFLKYEASRCKRNRGGEIKGSSVGPSHIRQVISALESHRSQHQHEDVYQACDDSKKPLRVDVLIKTFEAEAAAKEPQRVLEAHALKAKGSSADCYTRDELIRMSSWCLNSSGGTPDRFCRGVRDRAMLLVSTTTALRGDNTRSLLWSDLIRRDVAMADISPDATIPALVFISNQGKTNSTGRLDEHGAFRHRFPELCCIGGLAFHFFGHFHILENKPPKFSPDFESDACGEFGRRPWYKIHLFPGGKGETEPMTYENHHSRLTNMHKKNGVDISKVTHAGRVFTTMTAREHNADAHDVKAHGRWQGSPFEACYDRGLPVGAMLGAAMFNAHNQQSYILPRGTLEPPAELLNEIFPWVESELIKYEERLRDFGKCAMDISLREFLHILKRFRLILLQDAAVLYEKHSNSDLYNYSPFNTPLFRNFATQSTVILAQAARRSCESCVKAPENIRGVLQAGFQEFYLDHSKQQLSAQQGQTRLQGDIDYMTSLVEVIQEPHPVASMSTARSNTTAGQQTLHLSTPQVDSAIATPALVLPHEPSHEPPLADAELVCIDSIIDSSTWDILRAAFPLSDDHVKREKQVNALSKLVQQFGPQRLSRHTFEWVQHTGSLPDEWLPFYDLKLRPTVEENWTEETLGLNGLLSIRELDTVWQARWKRNNQNTKTVSTRRKKIITLIHDLSNKTNWNTELALRFLAERFPISPQSSPHLRTIRAFVDYLQSTKTDARKIILAEADSYASRRG